MIVRILWISSNKVGTRPGLIQSDDVRECRFEEKGLFAAAKVVEAQQVVDVLFSDVLRPSVLRRDDLFLGQRFIFSDRLILFIFLVRGLQLIARFSLAYTAIHAVSMIADLLSGLLPLFNANQDEFVFGPLVWIKLNAASEKTLTNRDIARP